MDGLLSIHHFARKWELRAAVRVVYVHGCMHVGVPTIAGCAAEAEESKEGQNSEGKGEGGKRDNGGTPKQAHPEVAVGVPDGLRFHDESRGEKTRSAKVAARSIERKSTENGQEAKQPD